MAFALNSFELFLPYVTSTTPDRGRKRSLSLLITFQLDLLLFLSYIEVLSPFCSGLIVYCSKATMAPALPLLVLSLFLSWSQVLAIPPTFQCKPLPGDLHWPSHSEWQALNSSVSGRLIKPVPPGAVCHPSWPQFDNATCELVATQQWASSSFHYKDPETSDYNDETCLPDPSKPCSDAGYPSYVVVAANAEDVQKAVKFAKNTGVRLIVKGTGHDFPGR